MKTLTFKCALLSDVVLHSRPASEGSNAVLDFIPGSCFLGIAASSLYGTEGTADLFHTGVVRFGDAHPSIGNIRSYKIPAAFCYPKLSKAQYYIHYAVDHNTDEIRSLQLKQCRNGYYVFNLDRKTGTKADLITGVAVKSAYDKAARRAKDEQMFCYESLSKGAEFIFDVETDRDDLADKIKDALIGIRHIGRSRTAQYGLVNISLLDSAGLMPSSDCGLTTVYADGRLVFFDNYGMPTFQPSPEQLGLPSGAEILWDKSQVRTFQYAPWNGKRRSYDQDRCGIEKGSVFVVRNVNGLSGSKYVGRYNNEGFGKVIYNPAFLAYNPDGTSAFSLENREPLQANDFCFDVSANGALAAYLIACQKESDLDTAIYLMVNKWVGENAGRYGNSFASQWGAVRDVASCSKGPETVEDEVMAFIGHGVSKDEWNKRGRGDKLLDFIKDCRKGGIDIRRALVNLCAEMAKRS